MEPLFLICFARIRQLGLLALLTVPIVALATQTATPSFYDQGKAAYRNHRWNDAASLMAKAEAQNPGQSDALLFEGQALANAGLFAQAEPPLSSYASAHPDSAAALYALALVQRRENKPAPSLTTYTAAAKLRTPNSEDLASVALDYVLLNDYPDAIRWLEKAVQFDPQNADAWYSLGRATFTQSRFREAEHAFTRALELDPKSVKAAENLGLTLDAENRSADAETYFKQAVTLATANSGGDEWPYLNYANFLLERERSAEAAPLLQHAIAIAPKCAACHEKLGRALAQNGDPQQGIAELEKAVALTPGEAHFHYELGLAYRQAGMTEKAKVELAASAKLYGTKAAGDPK